MAVTLENGSVRIINEKTPDKTTTTTISDKTTTAQAPIIQYRGAVKLEGGNVVTAPEDGSQSRVLSSGGGVMFKNGSVVNADGTPITANGTNNNVVAFNAQGGYIPHTQKSLETLKQLEQYRKFSSEYGKTLPSTVEFPYELDDANASPFPYELDNADGSLSYGNNSQSLTPFQRSVLQKMQARQDALRQRFGTSNDSAQRRLQELSNYTGTQRNKFGDLSYNRKQSTPSYDLPSYSYSADGMQGTNTNGKVDLDFKQGQTGDCWLLSTIQAIRDKEGGQEHLNSLLSVDKENGDVSVYLPGAGKSYRISKEEIDSQSRLSSGDGDVRAIELAIDKHYKSNGISSGVENRPASEAMELLVGNAKYGKGSSLYDKEEHRYTPFNYNEFNAKNKSHVVSFHGGNANCVNAVNTSTNEVKQLVNNHGYAVSGVDNQYVYLKNPWNTSELLKVDINEFRALNPQICSTTLNK